MKKRLVPSTRDWIQTPIFAYGTLRPGERNYMRLLCGYTVSEFPAEVDHMRLYSLGAFPVMLDAEPDGGVTVKGEVMVLHPAHYPRLLAELDRLEGYNPNVSQSESELGLYRRVRRRVRLGGGAEAWAWLYIGNPEVLASHPHTEIPHGDWLRHQRELGKVGRVLRTAKIGQN
ncbi:MAG: gamma-glutamylcyclotransferase family protein [Aggregatilineales bacterium]